MLIFDNWFTIFNKKKQEYEETELIIITIIKDSNRNYVMELINKH